MLGAMLRRLDSLSNEAVGRLFALPRFLIECARCLRLAGHGVWIVGGSARDLLRGVTPEDWDLGTSARPDEVEDCVPKEWLARDEQGRALGTVRLAFGAETLEVTTLRRELDYDGRRPARVEFVREPDSEWERRDFSANALYLDPFELTLLDFCSGLEDLQAGRLRAIGDAHTRFREDRLRILRALRFCTQLGWVAEKSTWDAVCAEAPGLSELSNTRIFDELSGLLTSAGRARGLMLLVSSGAAAAVLPGLSELGDVPQPPEYHPEGDVLRHTALVLGCLREPVDQRLAWAALWHDVGKRDTFVIAEDRIRFDGHDRLSAELAERWLLDHGAGPNFVKAVVEVIDEHIRIAAVPGFRVAKRARFLRDEHFDLHLEFHRADCLACHASLEIHDELLSLQAALPPPLPEPLLRGRDVIELGVPAGPRVGEILAAIEEAQLVGAIRTREAALGLAQDLLTRGSN